MAQSLIRGSTQILDGSVPVSKLVSGFLIPTANLTQGANFIQRDGSIAFTAGQSMGGFILSNVADAVSAQDGVNLRTAQALINGIAIKRARLVSIANQALTGAVTVDSVAGVTGDIILLTAQTSTTQNGLWTINTAGAWTRPTTWAAATAQKSTLFLVEEGTVYHDTKWLAITDAITVDTTSVTITQDSSGTSYTNGNGLSLVGSTFAVKTGNGIAFDGSQNVTLALNGSSLNNGASGVKISDAASAGQVLIGGAANAATFTTFSGDVSSISSSGVVALVSTGASGVVKIGKLKFQTVPSGTINGSNTSFTLPSTPVVGTESLYLNGQRLQGGAGNDYTISATAITMLFAPVTGDKITADYLEA